MVDENHKFYTKHYAAQLLIITHIYVPVAVNVNCNSRSYQEQHLLLTDCIYTTALFNYHVHGAHTDNAGIINELAKRPVRLDSCRVLVAISRNIQDN